MQWWNQQQMTIIVLYSITLELYAIPIERVLSDYNKECCYDSTEQSQHM